MRTSTKIVSVIASTALVVGAGALAAAPAGAKPKGPQPTGTTVINVPMAIITAAADDSVTIAPIAPSEGLATATSVGLTFPITGPAMDGGVNHLGGISLASGITGITLTLTKPVVSWPTGRAKPLTGTISATINGIPDSVPLKTLNGTPINVFDVKNMKIVVTTGKVEKNGSKGYKRTDTQKITGVVTLYNNQLIVDGINGLMGTPGLFKPGMPFGTLDTSWSMTRTCKTKAECKA